MTYFLYFFLAFATLFLTPWVGADALARQEGLMLYVPLLLWLPHGLGFGVRRMQMRGRRRAAQLGELLLRYLPVLLQAVVLLGMGGLALLQRLWPVSLGELHAEDSLQWPGLALALAMLPYFLFQVLVIDARARLFGSGAWLQRARAFQLRMFLSMLVPFALIGLCSSLLDWNHAWSVRIEEVGLLGAALGLVVLFLAMLVLPRLMTWVWGTESLPAGALRGRLEALAQRADVRLRDLLIWRTGRMLPNALIVGFSPGTRRVLLTDELMEMLSHDELEAVFAHELGHAKAQHGLLLGAFALGALLGTEVLIASLGPWLVETWGGDQELISMGLFLLALVVWGRSFGAFSRLLEMEADLESLRSTGNLSAIVNTLLKVTGPGAARKSSWRHPSTAKRVGFLLQVAGDVRIGERLRSKLRWLKRSVLLLFVSCVAYRGYFAVMDWDRDWLLVDLRLGNYRAAEERLESGIAADESLAALVGVGAELGSERVQLEDLLSLGLVRLQGGDAARALRLVELAFLRDQGAVGGLLKALDKGLSGQGTGAESLPRAWQEALDALPDQ